MVVYTDEAYEHLYPETKEATRGAIELGAWHLEKLDEKDRAPLKKRGLLTRDARKKERKKYGQKGARARFQFSKR